MDDRLDAQRPTATAAAEPAAPAGTRPASRVPALGHVAATSMASEELDRFLTQLDGLAPADWAAPTACTRWDVRAIVAHVAGAAASYAHAAEFRRQWNPRSLLPYRRTGLGWLDAANEIQISDRAGATPAALIAELRHVGPRAIATRRRLPAPLRAVRLPMPLLGVAAIGYLTDVIYTRDMWIHRLDIARATGRAMDLTPAHDGRMIALIARDLAPVLTPLLGERAVVSDLAGPAGGRFRFGGEQDVAATIRLDALDFAWLAAGRLTPAAAETSATIAGDQALARRVLAATTVPF